MSSFNPNDSVNSGSEHSSLTTGQQSAGNPWLFRVLSTIIVMALIIYIGKGCNGSTAPEDDSTMVASPKINEGPSNETALPAHESLKVKLPDGVELDAFKGGIEDQLVTFLNNPSAVAGKNAWFDFDNLSFKTGSADITEESIKQVQNIAAILKAYPKLKIKIGGYTDKTGDSLANFKLSQGRAESVLSALKSSGANPSQLLGAEGYGSSFAKAPTDAPDEERKKDRRISVSVREK
jgi:outer membrane protein OmpA-like peptidoglycan-associated protein